MGRTQIIISLDEFLDFFKEKPRTNKDVCEKWEVSQSTARKHINKLVECNVLELIGSSKYRLIEP